MLMGTTCASQILYEKKVLYDLFQIRYIYINKNRERWKRERKKERESERETERGGDWINNAPNGTMSREVDLHWHVISCRSMRAVP